MALYQSISLSVHSSAQVRLGLKPVSSLNSSSQMYVSDCLSSYIEGLGIVYPELYTRDVGRTRLHARANGKSLMEC
jgi:hypothetical protein